ncbi:carbohydrate kinase [Spartobacteria bacterium LR76]|nr:carbohydrate kinase [Spartobacteria bacterium LR76]
MLPELSLATMSKSSLQPFDILEPAEIASILDKLSMASVAVVGDFCLDVYWTIDPSASEDSVETGLRTQPVRQQRYSPGGAGNVVANLVALGAHRIYPVGVLGEDPFGRELRRLLEHPSVDQRGLISQVEGWATHSYVKPYVDSRELNRIDHGNFNRLSADTQREFFERLEEIVEKVSVVLINHQVIGSIHDDEGFRGALREVMERHPSVCFVVDSRKYHEAYTSAVHKLNEAEVMRSCGISLEPGDVVPVEELAQRAGELYARWGAPLVVTRGDRGCFVFSSDVVWQIFGVQLPGRIDPVGAGDTFVATLAAILSSGVNIAAAAFVANVAAAVTAQKLFQTGTASPGEVLALGANADFYYNPELSESPHRARYLDGTEIEVITEPSAALNIRYAIFDHDGTISTLREGWEQIMEPMMIKAVLGEHFRDAEAATFHRAQYRVREFIERTTGIQTIAQMHGLVDLIREFGLVPEESLLTPAEYKAIYNTDLQTLVDRRLEKLDRGELEISDFTIKGAVPFLYALKQAGVRLYLASGTDEADVKIEAARLGYADVFDGGIYGSIGQITKDAKRMVIERILQEVGGAFEQLVAFGDGPVEIRETNRRGSYAVGIASDEKRRFGTNLDKRPRLVRAGAHAIIPDFSQWEALWSFLRLGNLGGR